MNRTDGSSTVNELHFSVLCQHSVRRFLALHEKWEPPCLMYSDASLVWSNLNKSKKTAVFFCDSAAAAIQGQHSANLRRSLMDLDSWFLGLCWPAFFFLLLHPKHLLEPQTWKNLRQTTFTSLHALFRLVMKAEHFCKRTHLCEHTANCWPSVCLCWWIWTEHSPAPQSVWKFKWTGDLFIYFLKSVNLLSEPEVTKLGE